MRFLSRSSLGVIVAVPVLLAACNGDPAATMAPTPPGFNTAPFKSSTSFPFGFFNECTGENVSGVVEQKSTIQLFTDANGGFHLLIHDVFTGRAVGETSGVQYVGPQSEHVSALDRSGEQFEFTDQRSFRFISEGGSDNLLVNVLIHLTVTPNGDVTSQVFQVTLDCTG